MDGLVSLGAGGAALVGSFALLAGVRGNNKLKIDKEDVPYWSFSIGLIAAAGGTAFDGIPEVGNQFNQAFQQAHGLGEWKVGATAAVLTIAIFGLKARPWKDVPLGAIAPTVFTAAGGLWALPVTIFGALLRALVGA
ncbi:hypothetical protein KV557_10015 [Kitasatospora aureofaciens]|uniref:hypothetical protein n=1 Tax=Kitasatospora aureofaciens TaxID=1894 RepID=UPI001C45D2E2|nr:hypothetical protein [Kitasatospora aureofaciens]MBV6697459.1 hypothetical protein [Kitasatospora aureofaciens]